MGLMRRPGYEEERGPSAPSSKHHCEAPRLSSKLYTFHEAHMKGALQSVMHFTELQTTCQKLFSPCWR